MRRRIAVAVAVAITGRPKLSATGRGKDARRRFALFNFREARQHVESFGDFLNDRATNDLFTGRKTVQQGVVAKVIDRARNSGRAAKDIIDRARRKNVWARRA